MSPFKFGYVPDIKDSRDHLFAAECPVNEHLPERVDFRDRLPDCYNQGLLNSCTANALAGLFLMVKEFDPSRLFIYYNSRIGTDNANQDRGARLRDGIKGLVKYGAPIEMTWPYLESKVLVTPPDTVYHEASNYKPTRYLRIVTLNDMVNCLAQGYPFVAGLGVTDDFLSIRVENTGEVKMPSANDSVTKWHATLVVGYDFVSKLFICRNSWGTYWGKNGYFTVPFNYLTNTRFCIDMWTIR